MSVPTVGLASTVTAWDGGWYLHTAQKGYPAGLTIVHGHATQRTVGAGSSPACIGMSASSFSKCPIYFDIVSSKRFTSRYS